MADVIQLLPDTVANQIAAGEVVQRPASVVKELIENAIDAGSTSIKLILKDAGKSLIQVLDNGCGMSESDARLSFERHATSKIRQAQDLFTIRTMGFRGEALASIAAVAQVEMKTKRSIDEIGSRIVVEGSKVKTQEPCQCNQGTSIAVKNLFFSIPARRNFLKSNNVENRHINDEFVRIAMANPDVFFSLNNDGNEIYHFQPGNLRQRITAVLGANSNKKLVPVIEETDIVKINGFVGKPEYAKKTRGDQYFFVNNRFIKSSYLHHAVMAAFENLLPKDTYPLYVVFIEVDPSRLDINIHPTKQEIKFDDEKLVYNYLRVAIRHALGQHSITPTLDFDQEPAFSSPKPRLYPDNQAKPSQFSTQSFGQPSGSEDHNYKSNLANWQKLYEGLTEEEEKIADQPTLFEETIPTVTIQTQWEDADTEVHLSQKIQHQPYQIHNSYIVSPIKSGFLLIDQQNAHERVLYEQFMSAINNQKISTQQMLFPKTLDLSPNDAEILIGILPQINALGFDIQEFGEKTFIINGIPNLLRDRVDEVDVIEDLLEQCKIGLQMELNAMDSITKAMAQSASIKRGQSLTTEEMKILIDQLFACELPYKSPSGKNCFITYDLDELTKRFNA